MNSIKFCTNSASKLTHTKCALSTGHESVRNRIVLNGLNINTADAKDYINSCTCPFSKPDPTKRAVSQHYEEKKTLRRNYRFNVLRKANLARLNNVELE